MSNQKITVTISVKNITYYDEKTGFHIIKAYWKEMHSQIITITGYSSEIKPGTIFKVTGEWLNHPVYGKQIKAESFEELMPATVEGIKRYLGSGLIKGIGPKTAEIIVNHFGAETIDIIEKDIKRLNEITGIGKKKIDMISNNWQKQKEIKNIMIFLQGHGISPNYAIKIYKRYGAECVKLVKENPYCIADDINGIGFKKADQIASHLGIKGNNPNRISAAIIYILKKLSEEGHIFGTLNQVHKNAAEILNTEENAISESEINDILTDMNDKKRIVEIYHNDDFIYYLPWLYKAETETATILNTLQNSSTIQSLWQEPDIKAIETKLKISYDNVQAQAIKAAVNNKVNILTGGPGTGKTTVTKGIIEAFLALKYSIILAAPTGKAAKRMSEATGYKAKTIHRLLEYGKDGFKKNKDNPLNGDVLIIDEASMLDIQLTYNLVQALPEKMSIIFVGDIDQLPSVGPGNVLNDLIKSRQFKVTQLTKIFRQAQTSDIVMNAHRINKGIMPELDNEKMHDFAYWDYDDEEMETAEINEQIKNDIIRIAKEYDNQGQEIQVLTPSKKGEIGTLNLNIVLQETLNHSTEKGINYGMFTYKPGDKIMQLKNNYDKDVFNGDTGTIETINDETIYIRFDEKTVEYDKSELDQINPAYAITIHKSQGSEFPIVVMPMTMSFYMMLQRNLLYTAVTRAKKGFILLGTKKAIATAVRNKTISRRNSLLYQRLQEIL